MGVSLIRGAALGIALTAASYGAALAAPVNFTWSPSAVGLTGGNITNANNFNVADFASINVGAGGAFTETGALTVLNFLNGGSTVSTPGLGTTYSLYFTFTGSGNQGGPIPPSGGSTTGPFSSLNYTLWANPNPTPTVTVAPGSVTLSGTTGAFALATGSLISGVATLTNVPGPGGGLSPTANLSLTFNACTGPGGACTVDASSFFVAPPSGQISLLIGNFSATPSVTSQSGSFILINGGGGNLTIEQGAVPEPMSIALMGTGLLGLSLLRRRFR